MKKSLIGHAARWAPVSLSVLQPLVIIPSTVLPMISQAMAADDAVIMTIGTGTPMKSKDVGGGKQAMQPIISDINGNPIGTTGNPVVVSPVGIAQGAATTGVTISGVGCVSSTSALAVTALLFNPCQMTLNGGVRFDQSSIGGTTIVADPCLTSAKSYTSINLAAATAIVIATGTTGKLVYVCDFDVSNGGAANLGIIEGTGGTCSGGTTAGVVGGTTAATGLQFAANSGLAKGNGAAAVWATHNTGNNICLVPSTTAQISGHMSFVLL